MEELIYLGKKVSGYLSHSRQSFGGKMWGEWVNRVNVGIEIIQFPAFFCVRNKKCMV